MPKYVIKYFNAKALAESLRLLLSYGNEEFEDIRVESTQHESWPEIKKTTLFGQLPVMYIDGKQYAESTPLSRYLGRLFGLAGDNPLEDLEIDMHVDYLHDIRSKLYIVHEERDPVLKEEKREKMKDFYHGLFAKLEEICKKNNGHLAANKLTWGDFYLAGVLTYLKYMACIPDFDERFPYITKTVENVESIPQVKKYVEKRPFTPR